MRLSQISGYLALQQITNLVKENVAVRVAEWRDRPSSAGSESSGLTALQEAVALSQNKTVVEQEEEISTEITGLSKEENGPPRLPGDTTHDIISFEKILNMTDVKRMATNMNRQAKNREDRKTTSSQDDDEEDW